MNSKTGLVVVTVFAPRLLHASSTVPSRHNLRPVASHHSARDDLLDHLLNPQNSNARKSSP
jgi:hypothetical protein